jgi:hypothetical protein
MPTAICKLCKKSFYVKPSHVGRGWGKYCSSGCLHESMCTGRHVSCVTCSKKIYRTPKHFVSPKSNNFFCSKSCFAVWKNKNLFVGERHANWKGGENTYRTIMKRSGIVPKCSNCGISDKRVLVVHHRDRDRFNNIISNLKWLCRNCHYIEHEGKTV